MNRLNRFKSNKKMLLLLIVPTVLLISLMSYNTLKNKQEAKAQEQIDSIVVKLNELESNVIDIYTNDEQDFINPNVTVEDVTIHKATLEDIIQTFSEHTERVEYNTFTNKRNTIDSLLLDISLKLDLEEKVNSFFEEDVIIGNRIKESVPVKKGLTLDYISGIERYNPINKATNWKDSINTLFSEAVQQVTLINEATEQTAHFFVDDEVIANATKEMYDSTLSKINKVSNESIQVALQTKMKPVLTQINENQRVADEVESLKQEASARQEEVGSIPSTDKKETEKPLVVTHKPVEKNNDSNMKKTLEKEVTKKEKVAKQSTDSKTDKKEAADSTSKKKGEMVYVGKDPITGGDQYKYEGDPIYSMEELAEVFPDLEFNNPDWD